MKASIPAAIVFGCAALSSACLKDRKVESIEGEWNTPLDGDLRTALGELEHGFSASGWDIHVRWLGARDASYTVERGVTGEPVRQSVEVMYGFIYTARNKCYLSPDGTGDFKIRLAREHLGGGTYGPPRIIGMAAMRDDAEPMGNEVTCAALDSVSGGVHISH